MTEQIAYSRAQAAAVSGYSPATIIRAINAGDLVETTPRVDGKPLSQGRIMRADLERWLQDKTPTTPKV